MQSFNFKVPTEIVFGRGAEDKAAENWPLITPTGYSSSTAAAVW
jgi:alcohol dehydrogenase YqhD (iron-dependent ADH family)